MLNVIRDETNNGARFPLSMKPYERPFRKDNHLCGDAATPMPATYMLRQAADDLSRG